MRKFYLITNISGLTYWSYKATKEAVSWLSPMFAKAVLKYGTIYINRNGGWMPIDCVSKILRTVEQMDFPPEA